MSLLGLGGRSACWLNIWVSVVYKLIALLFTPLSTLYLWCWWLQKDKDRAVTLSVRWNKVNLTLLDFKKIIGSYDPPPPPPPLPLTPPSKSQMSDKALSEVYLKKKNGCSVLFLREWQHHCASSDVIGSGRLWLVTMTMERMCQSLWSKVPHRLAFPSAC